LSWLAPFLSATASFGFAAILVLGVVVPKSGRGAFWPPPSVTSWQSRAFRWLFRIGVGSLLGLSIVLVRAQPSSAPFALQGAAMFGLGFGMALRITRQMGWGTAFGGQGRLITQGWFAHSRNPVYVATWLGLVGWALLVPHYLALIPMALWAAVYVAASFWEEPWLRQTYGAAYDEYAERVPRFF
jgi:protein-S-isoprenylcysteine O-methyltransferase Ste14